MHSSILQYRAALKRKLRAYLDEAGILEVDVPILARNACPDPYVEPISFMWQGQRVFLQPSPELFLKRLLSQHPDDMYSLSSCFRSDPVSPLHNPEFMMLEFYLTGEGRYAECQKRTCDIVGLFLPGLETQYWDYEALWWHYLHAWPQSREDYFDLFEQHSLCFEKHWSLQNYHDFLFATLIQPFLGISEITVVQNFPLEQAALAKINASGKAERFEVFFKGTELANGYHELVSLEKNMERFEQWRWHRKQEKQLFWDDDGLFLQALKTFPPCSGVAIGIDRLFLLGSGFNSLSESMPFSWERC